MIRLPAAGGSSSNKLTGFSRRVFGQGATSRSTLTKQTPGWVSLEGWGQAGVGTGQVCGHRRGWCCCSWPQCWWGGKGLGPGTRGRDQFPSGAVAAAQGSAWKHEEDLTTALRLSLLLFCSSPGSAPFSYPFIHSILSCLPQLCFNPGEDTASPQCDPSCLISPCR